VTARDDHRGEAEMNRTLDDDTTEALLAGRGPMQQGEVALLREFVDVLRSGARGPVPPPSAALASLLEGSGIRQPTPLPVGAAREATPRRAGRKPRTLTARVAAAGLLVKVGLGVSMAAASVGGAAAAGLPVAEAVVEAVTPVEFGDRHQVRTSTDRPRASEGTDRDSVETGTGGEAELEVGGVRDDGERAGAVTRHVNSLPAGGGSDRLAAARLVRSAAPPAAGADRPTTVEDERPDERPGEGSGQRDRDDPDARAHAASSPGDTSHGPPDHRTQRSLRSNSHGRHGPPAFGRR
jgi:hypothetical protein